MRTAYLACECLLEALGPSKYAYLKRRYEREAICDHQACYAAGYDAMQRTWPSPWLLLESSFAACCSLSCGFCMCLPLISVDHSLNWCLILCTLKPSKEHEALVLLISSSGSQSAITIITHLILLSVASLFDAGSCLHHHGPHTCTPKRKQDDDADDVVRRLSKLNTAEAFPRSRIPLLAGSLVRPGEVAPGSIVLFLCSMDLL